MCLAKRNYLLFGGYSIPIVGVEAYLRAYSYGQIGTRTPSGGKGETLDWAR